jgi:hypothetical protein
MSPIRIARNVSTVAVASIAAWSSWSHTVHVALRFGERPEVAYVLPISVDGMLIVASTAMVEDQRAGRPVRWSARIAFLAGVGASVAANIAAAQPRRPSRGRMAGGGASTRGGDAVPHQPYPPGHVRERRFVYLVAHRNGHHRAEDERCVDATA